MYNFQLGRTPKEITWFLETTKTKEGDIGGTGGGIREDVNGQVMFVPLTSMNPLLLPS